MYKSPAVSRDKKLAAQARMISGPERPDDATRAGARITLFTS